MGEDLDDQLYKMCEFFGTENLYHFIEQHRIEVKPEVMKVIYKHLDTKPVWENMLSTSNIRHFDVRALDLLNKLLNMNAVWLLG